MRQLHDSGEYQRVVIVGHSLGTIICYDLIKLFWAERERFRTMTEGDALHGSFLACESAAKALPASGIDEGRLAAFQAAQNDVLRALVHMDVPPDQSWLISDFVTLGCPLTHAPFLLAHDRKALDSEIAQRRFPVCPPTLDEESGGFLYRPGAPGVWRAHHASPFAAVRWTNICDPPRFALFGDLISGLVGPDLRARNS